MFCLSEFVIAGVATEIHLLAFFQQTSSQNEPVSLMLSLITPRQQEDANSLSGIRHHRKALPPL